MEPLSRTKFSELEPPLSHDTLSVLEEQGFVRATPVQAAAIPLLCMHKDVAVDAATGSGKTLAFIVPMVEIFRRMPQPLKRHQIGAVIISPTRELASQIFQVADPFVKTLSNVTALLLVGGTDISLDLENLQCNGANILIGTPGRLNDIIQRAGFLDYKLLDVLILDEADRLLDMGFHHQLSSIIYHLPKQRRTGLFSATQTEAVEELAKAGLRNPVKVEVRTKEKGTGIADKCHACSKTPTGLNIKFLQCKADEKPSQLVQILLELSSKKAIVYFMTCACVEFWGTALSLLAALKGTCIIALHGKMKQSARERSLARFTAMSHGVLLSTDVAARGLDIPGVDWILQYDPPQDPNVFVHRVGRTARMGRSGNALVFLLPKEEAYVEFLRIRRIPIEEKQKSLVQDVIPLLRASALEDRNVMDKGIKAFVSYIRAYKEHQCNFIFRWKELDVGSVALGYGLLQLPAMPEIRRGVFSGSCFKPVEGIDFSAIKYKDKTREKQRQEKLLASTKLSCKQQDPEVGEKGKRFLSTKPSCKQQELEAGSKKKQMKARKETGKQRKVAQAFADDEELERDYRLLKKLKKGLISERDIESDDLEISTGCKSRAPADSNFAGSSSKSSSGARSRKKNDAMKHDSRISRRKESRPLRKHHKRRVKYQGKKKGRR